MKGLWRTLAAVAAFAVALLTLDWHRSRERKQRIKEAEAEREIHVDEARAAGEAREEHKRRGDAALDRANQALAELEKDHGEADDTLDVGAYYDRRMRGE